MTTGFFDYHGSVQFDEKLKQIAHFINFPEMMPWIGREYDQQRIKVLIIGESYFFKGATFHHSPSDWYSKTFRDNLSNEAGDLSHRRGHRVRYHITRSIDNNFKKNTHAMHRNLNSELQKTALFASKKGTPFNSIAYLNYFQRPAKTEGATMSIERQDLEVSLDTIKQVIDAIKPEVVLFASRLAYQTARKDNLFSTLDSRILYDYSAHPCSPHWNRACKKYGNIRGRVHGALRGKERFIKALDDMVNSCSRVSNH